MSLELEPEPLHSDARFRPHTVQKAVALAQQMEQERRETLSLDEVRQLAEELHLDPQVLQQALTRVNAEEARAAHSPGSHRWFTGLGQQRRSAVLMAATLLLSAPLFLGGLYALRRVPVGSPPVATEVMAASQVENGALRPALGQRGALALGLQSLPGWEVVGEGLAAVTLDGAESATFLRLGRSGGLRQMFRATPGQRYELRLQLSGAANQAREFHSVAVRVGNVTTQVGTFRSATPGGAPEWETVTVPFTANGSLSPLEITARSGPRGASEPYLKSVTVAP